MTLDKMTLDKMTLDKMTFDKMTLEKLTLDKMTDCHSNNRLNLIGNLLKKPFFINLDKHERLTLEKFFSLAKNMRTLKPI